MDTSLKGRVYSVLNPRDTGSKISSAVNNVIIILILLNMITASLETLEGFRVDYLAYFVFLEIVSVVIFTVEFALRLWSAPAGKEYSSRVQFILSFDAIVDLLAIAPFYLGIFFGMDLRALIALRLLRLLKLVRYFEPLTILAKVMKAEFRAFIAALFVLMILVFIAATGIYFFERHSQPDVFSSIPHSMWWAIVTLTTLGYGDVVPITAAGRFFAAMITIMSIGTVALPAGMLASRFSEELRKRKSDLAAKISVLTSDGSRSLDAESLEEIRRKLCLSQDDMDRILSWEKNKTGHCPLCNRESSHVE